MTWEESWRVSGLTPTLLRHISGLAAGKAGDTRCDIYSFGAMLYEMLTGHSRGDRA